MVRNQKTTIKNALTFGEDHRKVNYDIYFFTYQAMREFLSIYSLVPKHNGKDTVLTFDASGRTYASFTSTVMR